MWFLALRHLRSRPLQTALTFLGILLGGTAYIVFAGMMLGFQGDIVERLLSLDAQLRISAREEPVDPQEMAGIFGGDTLVRWLREPAGLHGNRFLSNVAGWQDLLDEHPQVRAWALQLVRPALLRSGDRQRQITLIGIQPNRQRRVTKAQDYIVAGRLLDLAEGANQLLVGQPLLDRVGARAGDVVELVAGNGTRHRLRIAAVYQTGTRGFDESVVYTELRTAQTIAGTPGEISDIVVRLADPAIATPVANDLQRLSRDKVESWEQAHDEIQTMFLMQNVTRNTVTSVIIIVVAFGIFNILNMSVAHKRRDLAILRAMGFDAHETARLFLWQGLILGIAGALCALIAGYIGLRWIDRIDISTPLTTGTMAVAWDIGIFARGALLSFAASVFASWFPARAAARLTPIEIIRSSI